jgi:hypothetical protein
MACEALEKIVRHLSTGTIPVDTSVQEVCGKITLYFVAFQLHGKEIDRNISVHVMDTSNEYGIPILDVHAVWTTLVMQQIVRHKKTLIGDFNGVSIKHLNDHLELYAAYTDLLSHPCSWCRQTYRSDVNRCRCEISHTSKKNLEERSVLPIGQLTCHWDSLDTKARTAIASHATRYVIGIPTGAKFSPHVTKLIRLASGDVDISGSELMVALDEASEYTFLFRPARPMKPMAILHRADFVAAMADKVIKALAQQYADSVTTALLNDDVTACKKTPIAPKKKKRPRAKKERPSSVSNIEKSPVIEPVNKWTLEYDETKLLLQIEKQMEVEALYSRKAYLSRLEKSVFAESALESLQFWADM